MEKESRIYNLLGNEIVSDMSEMKEDFIDIEIIEEE